MNLNDNLQSSKPPVTVVLVTLSYFSSTESAGVLWSMSNLSSGLYENSDFWALSNIFPHCVM